MKIQITSFIQTKPICSGHRADFHQMSHHKYPQPSPPKEPVWWGSSCLSTMETYWALLHSRVSSVVLDLLATKPRTPDVEEFFCNISMLWTSGCRRPILCPDSTCVMKWNRCHFKYKYLLSFFSRSKPETDRLDHLAPRRLGMYSVPRSSLPHGAEHVSVTIGRVISGQSFSRVFTQA